MSFPMVVAISTEALLLTLVSVSIMRNEGKRIEECRRKNPSFKPEISDWAEFVILSLWIGFQAWKVISVIRTLL